MTAPGVHVRRRPRCVARYVPGGSPARTEGEVHELLEHVQRTAADWAMEISSHLELPQICSPILLTLRQGPALPMSRDNEIVLPVGPGAPGLAALSHELVHVLAGRSQSQLLNEGLAVHVDAGLRLAGPVWPFYRLDPHRWVALFRRQGSYLPLSELQGHSWVTFPTPAQVEHPSTGDGGPDLQAAPPVASRYYLEGGSFVGFLLDHLGTEAFWARFRAGVAVLKSERCDEIEQTWLATLGGPPTAAEVKLGEQSLAEFQAQRLAWESVAGR